MITTEDFPKAATSGYVRLVPDRTLEALARSIHKEGLSYGLSPLDFIRFVNLLLDRVIKDEEASALPPGERATGDESAGIPRSPLGGLPCGEGRIQLRQFDIQSDIAMFERWLSDPHGRQFLRPRSTGVVETNREYLARNSEHIAVVLRENGSPIGAVAYFHHDPIHERAELRKVIGEPAARRQGYAREATRLWIRYGFEVLGLRKIYLDTMDTNLRNIRLNESVGFVVEGILRNEYLVDGQERDVLRMGLCRPGGAQEAPEAFVGGGD